MATIRGLHPVIPSGIPTGHFLYGEDLRSLPDQFMLEAASRSVLPRNYWVHLSENASNGLHEDEARDLASSVGRRLERMLRIQDRVASLSPGDVFDVGCREDAIEDLIVFMVHLCGIFDALALLAADEDFLINRSRVGWQKKPFLKSQRDLHPAAASVMNSTQRGGRFLSCMLLLRNQVHGAVFDHALSIRHEGDPANASLDVMFRGPGHRAIVKGIKDMGWEKYVGIRIINEDFALIRVSTLLGLARDECIVTVCDLIRSLYFDWQVHEDEQDGCTDKYIPVPVQVYAAQVFGLLHLVRSEIESNPKGAA